MKINDDVARERAASLKSAVIRSKRDCVFVSKSIHFHIL